MRLLFAILRLRSIVSISLLLWPITQKILSFYHSVSPLAVATLRATSGGFPARHFVISGVGRAWSWFSNIVERPFCIPKLHLRQFNTVLSFFHFCIRFLWLLNVAIGAVNELKGSNFFNTSLKAAAESRSIFMSVSKLYQITILRSTSNILCWTTLITAHQISSTIVDHYVGPNSWEADVISCAIKSSTIVHRFLIG